MGGAGSVIDVFFDHQWTSDPTENPGEVKSGCKAPEEHAEEVGLYR